MERNLKRNFYHLPSSAVVPISSLSLYPAIFVRPMSPSSHQRCAWRWQASRQSPDPGSGRCEGCDPELEDCEEEGEVGDDVMGSDLLVIADVFQRLLKVLEVSMAFSSCSCIRSIHDSNRLQHLTKRGQEFQGPCLAASRKTRSHLASCLI